MRLPLLLAAALLAVAPLGCKYGDAPRCESDADCEHGRRCIVAAGVCVGYDTPLLPAPDGGPEGGAADASTDAAGADAHPDAATGG